MNTFRIALVAIVCSGPAPYVLGQDHAGDRVEVGIAEDRSKSITFDR